MGSRLGEEREAVFRRHLRDLADVPILTSGGELAAAALVSDGRVAENELASLTQSAVTDIGTVNELRERVSHGEAARAALIGSTRRLVVSLARRHQADAPRSEALMAAGTVALSRAVDRYDPTGGLPFSAFARWWVERAMREVEHHPVADAAVSGPSPADPTLLTALGHLHERDCKVIELRMGLGATRPLSEEETANVLGLDLEDEQQVEAEALAKLRHPSTPGDLSTLRRL